jgi:type I restriction enzyme S subunit
VSYLLLTLNFAVQNVAAAVPGVNRNFLHQLSVRVPPLPT